MSGADKKEPITDGERLERDYWTNVSRERMDWMPTRHIKRRPGVRHINAPMDATLAMMAQGLSMECAIAALADAEGDQASEKEIGE